MSAKIWHSDMTSPLGKLRLESDGVALTRIALPLEKPKAVRQATRQTTRRDDLEVFAAARHQLQAYFSGQAQEFDLPLAPSGTPFQREVWAELRRIPRGETISYAELAQRVGSPRAHRAVGAANGQNPLPIVVPCHRVVGSNGRLMGFAGGLEAKAWLLRLEKAPLDCLKTLPKNT
jgi:methylated-DNA-[protein]-cysteine S-methyltransferase